MQTVLRNSSSAWCILLIPLFKLLVRVSATNDPSGLQFTYLVPENTSRPSAIKEDETVQFSVSRSPGGLSSEVRCSQQNGKVVRMEKLSQSREGARFQVTGRKLGVETLTCSEQDEIDAVEVLIEVLRKTNKIDTFFVPYVFTMVCLFNLAFGTEIEVGDLRFIISKPFILATAAFCQFILLPPLGLALIKIMDYKPDVALGLLMVACAPGGGDSNAVAYLVDGELPLSISMTFFSTILAIGMMPLNLFIYGRFITTDPSWKPQDIPYLQLALTLLLLAVPVCLGMLLRNRFPKYTERLMKWGKIVIILLLIIFFCLALVRNLFAFELVGSNEVLGACLFPLCGFLIGGLVAISAKLRFSQVKTIAFEVGMQNAGIVIGMALLAFEQPYADLNGILPIFMALTETFIVIPFLLLHGIFYNIYPKYRELCKKDKEAQMTEREEFERQKHAVENELGIFPSTQTNRPDTRGTDNPSYKPD
ncbi:ileal sodium/bile acid cotransporter-like isoform X2 [Convolutriloba macropyga]|uniref:ileal sodium/bile acid cotransporter-like isoform X2 n=1 Tax=Convolutriloba macropyga TaxID=536237 RepID=UPI003F520EE9